MLPSIPTFIYSLSEQWFSLSFTFTGKKKRLDRWEATLLLVIYIVYTVKLVTGQ